MYGRTRDHSNVTNKLDSCCCDVNHVVKAIELNRAAQPHRSQCPHSFMPQNQLDQMLYVGHSAFIFHTFANAITAS